MNARPGLEPCPPPPALASCGARTGCHAGPAMAVGRSLAAACQVEIAVLECARELQQVQRRPRPWRRRRAAEGDRRAARAIGARRDTISRYGGDEFLCLLLDIDDEEQVAGVARKLFDAVSAPCQLGEISVAVSPSIGIVVYPRDGTTVDRLLACADSAMYAAKQRRLGHAFFNRTGSPASAAGGARIPA